MRGWWKCTRTVGCQYSTTSGNRPPIISINNATFYRHHPNISRSSTSNPPLFQDLTFELPSFAEEEKHWAIIGPSSAGKTTFLQVLRGKHICSPAAARSWPYLESLTDSKYRSPNFAIKLVGFDGEQGLGARAPQSAYLSARYESRREDTDFSVLDYLLGNTDLNLVNEEVIEPELLQKVIEDLRLGDLVDMPVSNLSNGQTRRSRIARALLTRPEILLLDEPFMGLDPMTVVKLSRMLWSLAKERSPRLVLSLRPQDPIPEWITDLIILKGNCEIEAQKKHQAPSKVIIESKEVVDKMEPTQETHIYQKSSADARPKFNLEALSRDGYPLVDNTDSGSGEPLVEMEGVKVHYSKWNRTLFAESNSKDGKEGLWWTIRRGEKWGIFGPNGSGKTTLLSLILSDHPQTYSLPIRLFGRSRLPEPGKPGISIFDLQSRIGHSSPEVHNHVPRSLTVRQVLENAWADTFQGVPKLNDSAHQRINHCLRWFEQDLSPHFFQRRPSLMQYIEHTGTHYGSDSVGAVREDSNAYDTNNRQIWADELIFGQLPFSAQRVALFLRAIVKGSDLIVLDEAFSGMDDEVRDRCLLFLAHGERKRFRYDVSQGQDGRWVLNSKHKWIVETDQVQKSGGNILMNGLTKEQALLCISHVREEIPGSIREWICLPEVSSGLPARFGRLNGPLEGNEAGWKEIWDID